MRPGARTGAGRSLAVAVTMATVAASAAGAVPVVGVGSVGVGSVGPVAGAALGWSAIAASTSTPGQPAQPGQPLSMSVVTVVDATRPTPAVLTQPRLPTRTLRTTLFVPTDATATMPLVVVAPGLSDDANDGEALWRAIARRGTVVAVVQPPLAARRGAAPPAAVRDRVNQPADLSLVVTQLVAAGSPVAGRIDPSKVAVVGHGSGGTSALDLIANPCCADQRVAAAVVIGGSANALSSGEMFTSSAPRPTLFVHGELDENVPLSLARLAYAATPGPTWFVTVRRTDGDLGLFGAGRRETAGQRAAALTVQTVTAFLDMALRGADERVIGDVVDSAPRLLGLDRRR